MITLFFFFLLSLELLTQTHTLKLDVSQIIVGQVVILLKTLAAKHTSVSVQKNYSLIDYRIPFIGRCPLLCILQMANVSFTF